MMVRVLCLALALMASVSMAKLVPVPGAGPMPEECVHQVPNGADIRHHPSGELHVFVDDSLHSVVPKCAAMADARASQASYPNGYDGWLSYTVAENKDSYDSFLGDFSVPVKPKQAPEVLYLFTGLQNVNWIPKVDPQVPVFDIIQPVLQYPGDYGEYWSIRSWYVTVSNGAMVSPEIQVEVGDNVFGNMTQTGAESWFVGSQNMRTGQGSFVSVTHPRLKTQPWAYNTLECYGCSSCAHMPNGGSSNFTNLVLTSGKAKSIPQWQVTPRAPEHKICNSLSVVENPSTVDILFNHAP